MLTSGEKPMTHPATHLHTFTPFFVIENPHSATPTNPTQTTTANKFNKPLFL